MPEQSSEKELKKFWENPIYKDPKKFLETVKQYVDIFHSAQIALPKSKKSEKFLTLLKKEGYRLSNLKLEENKIGQMFLNNLVKKFNYWEVKK